jgi:DNA ligase D-like protein (predicted ligase)
MPPAPGVKRLAVQTEDHPMEYLTFDGKIPKGQYGGGDMWIYALGKYQITKDKKDGFYFRLSSRELNGEYRIYKIKEKEWLMERVDIPQVDYLHDNIEFMLSDHAAKPPASDEYVYEVKWDGIRAMIYVEDGKVRLMSRNQNDITKQFPELLVGDKAFRSNCGVFDAEIICVDSAGRPDFKKVINRLMATGETNIEKMQRNNPAYCYVFDCLYMDGRSLINETLMKRREFLLDSIRSDTPYRVSEVIEDGQSLFEAAKEHNLEGIMAKMKTGKYFPGKRSEGWIKIKVRNTADVVVIGYNTGKGNRATAFGGLHIAEKKGDELIYRGKVGTGFNDKTIQEIFEDVKKLKETKKPIPQKVLDEKSSTWVEPKLYVEVSYASLTRDKIFREPVFVRMRPDLGT